MNEPSTAERLRGGGRVRKLICTATVFIGLIGIGAAMIMIQVPNSELWYWHGVRVVDDTATSSPLIWWVMIEVAPPLGVAAMVWLVVLGAWKAAEAICGKLRGEA